MTQWIQYVIEMITIKTYSVMNSTSFKFRTFSKNTTNLTLVLILNVVSSTSRLIHGWYA